MTNELYVGTLTNFARHRFARVFLTFNGTAFRLKTLDPGVRANNCLDLCPSLSLPDGEINYYIDAKAWF